VWGVATLKPLRELPVPPNEDFRGRSSDGKLLAVVPWKDSTIRLRDAATGKIVAEFTGHRGRVSSVAFSPDGRLLAAGGADSTILVWQRNALVRPKGPPAP
jgi:WD40 repeat protein